MPYPVASCRGRNWTSGAWTPLLPTTDGGVSPHTVIVPALGLTDYFYQDSAKTTTAASDGDPVGACVNRGSDVYDVTQAAAGAEPTLKLNILNGQPVLRFDGGDNAKGLFNGGVLLSQPMTIFVVTKLDASIVDNDGLQRVFSGYSLANRVELYQGSATPDSYAVYAGATGKGGVTDDDWHLWTVLVNGANSQTWIDGVSVKISNFGGNSLEGITLGSLSNDTAFWIGDTAACLIYDANISNADKNQVGAWVEQTFMINQAEI